ncbi:MAG: NAD-dependent epimerase/dehydratase family protein [Phormidium sp. GEM2.Bin31]|nr:GDP-mannose 4,6-dehydratase [Phormidium sp. BM_Day4_Bin.17]TVR11030.1 MAG: NAD-dependent epimerase/dehydratase family protein [Phormidium sp. GEM2.Bin31]UCJ10906.1 MAG: GDP-mannose 4,6-dehydratase [Phormidium sp. PBR-2020]
MSKVIVTGAAGFVGSTLVETLLAQGHHVIGIDGFTDYYDTRIKHRNLDSVLNEPRFQLIQDDIRNLDWPSLFKEVDVVYHQAAQAGVRASWGKGFQTYTELNINSTQVLLEAAKDANLSRFVYASSSSVYGNAIAYPTTEETLPQPVSPYGVTKLAAEHLCRLYHVNYGVPTVSLRYFTVYGPRQRPDMAFHKFLKAALDNEPISVYGDGQQTRDFTFVQDIVAANLAAAEAPGAIGEVFNVGGGSRISLRDTISMMEEIVGEPIPINYTESSKGDARHTSADVSKAQQILSYQPQVSLQEGLKQEWEWLQQLYTYLHSPPRQPVA